MNSSRHSRSARDMDDESRYTNVTNPDAHQTGTRMHASKRGMSLSSLHTHMTVGEEDSNKRGQESLVPLNAVQALQESRRTHLTMGQDESWHTQVTMGQDVSGLVSQDLPYHTCNLIHDDTCNLINHDTCNAMNDMSYQRQESPVHWNAPHESRSSHGGRDTSTYDGSAVILHTLMHTDAPPSRNLTGTHVSGRCLASASHVSYSNTSHVSYSNTSAGPGNGYLDVTDHVVHHVLTSPRQLPTSPRLHRPQETVRERRTAIDAAPETHTWLSPPQQHTPPLQHDTMWSTHARLSFAQQQPSHAALGIEEVREGGRSMSQSTSRTDGLHHFVHRQPHHHLQHHHLQHPPIHANQAHFTLSPRERGSVESSRMPFDVAIAGERGASTQIVRGYGHTGEYTWALLRVHETQGMGIGCRRHLTNEPPSFFVAPPAAPEPLPLRLKPQTPSRKENDVASSSSIWNARTSDGREDGRDGRPTVGRDGRTTEYFRETATRKERWDTATDESSSWLKAPSAADVLDWVAGGLTPRGRHAVMMDK